MEISQDRSIELTNTATDKIMSVLKEGDCTKFRVYVTGGGCSGFQYGFKFDDDGALQWTPPAVTFSKGQQVAIVGLQARADLNGLIGEVICA